jgi:tetratricopeptide (TPR) repeat protein
MKKILLICAAVIISAATMSAQDMAKATETYNNAANTLQTDKVAALGMFQQALKMGEACGADGAELVTNCKNAIPGVILSIGKELYNNKDIAGALTKFQEAAKAAKEYGNTDVATEAGDLISHATTLKDMEDGKAAMESVRTAKTATDAAKGYAQAITSFKKVMAADTTNAAAALYLGQALSATGDLKAPLKLSNTQQPMAKRKLPRLRFPTFTLRPQQVRLRLEGMQMLSQMQRKPMKSSRTLRLTL